MKIAVCLLSGGLDSATTAAIAVREGYEVAALTIDYGQRNAAEIEAAGRIAMGMRIGRHEVLRIDLRAFGGSALTDDIEVPKGGLAEGVPVTYVPARNTVFLSLALAWAEALGARDIFIGVNAVDYSGYPDCRPEFIGAFEHLASVATKAGVEGERFRVHAPLAQMAKADIVRLALELGVDVGATTSCYDPGPDGEPCGACDSCRLRTKGFSEAGVIDPRAG